MTDPEEIKESVYLALLLEALEVSDAMREALTAAARLMQQCTCQNKRRQESLAAVRLANAAIDRLARLNAGVLKLLARKEVVQ